MYPKVQSKRGFTALPIMVIPITTLFASIRTSYLCQARYKTKHQKVIPLVAAWYRRKTSQRTYPVAAICNPTSLKASINPHQTFLIPHIPHIIESLGVVVSPWTSGWFYSTGLSSKSTGGVSTISHLQATYKPHNPLDLLSADHPVSSLPI